MTRYCIVTFSLICSVQFPVLSLFAQIAFCKIHKLCLYRFNLFILHNIFCAFYLYVLSYIYCSPFIHFLDEYLCRIDHINRIYILWYTTSMCNMMLFYRREELYANKKAKTDS